MVRATDLAGNVAGSNFHLSLTGTLPAPNSLQITPGMVNMLVGDTQQFTAVDDQNQPRSDATWTVSDTTLASITTDASPVLTALAVGQVTLTANVGALSAQVQVNIAGTALSAGTVRWSVPPLTTNGAVSSVLQAAPVQGAPALYEVEREVGSDGSVGTSVRAFTADGRSMWTPFNIISSTDGSTQGLGTSDATGGILTTWKSNVGCIPGETQISDHDGQTGALIWNTVIDYDCGNPSVAVGPEGHVYFTDAARDSLITLDGNTGARIAGYQLPLSTFGVPGDISTTYGQISNPVVGPDGTVFALAVKFIDNVTEQVWLLAMTPSGSTTVTQIQEGDNIDADVVFAKVITDGQGSAFAAWQDGSGAVHMTHGANDTIVSLASIPDEIVLDENGVVYAAVNFGGQGTITALAGGTSILWSYQTSASDSVHLIGALGGPGGVIVIDQQQGLIALDANGNPGTPSGTPFATPVTLAPSIVSPFTLGNWAGPMNGAISMIAEPAWGGSSSGTNFAISPSPMADGDTQRQHHYQQPVIAHFIPVIGASLGIDPQTAVNEIIQDLPEPSVAYHLQFLELAATVQAFTETLKTPLSAVGFIGHSIDVPNVLANPTAFTSIGLSFAEGNQVLVLPPNPRTLFPIPQYANSVITTRIQTQAKVVFIGSCYIGSDFQSLWNINNTTTGQAMLVPKSTTVPVILGHALVAWTRLLDDMILRHMSVQSALTETNAYLLTLPPDANGNPVTEQWQIIGDSSVRIN